MKVLVTGGTGFVGSHTVASLLNDGHDVRLLVRSRDRVEAALKPLGVDSAQVEVVDGDVTDRSSVNAAVTGADATVHGASVFSMDKRRAKQMGETNKLGSEVVLGEAHEAGHDPIVYISSIVAVLSGERGGNVSQESPVTPFGSGAYRDSKAEQEIVAREFQSRGAPVVITYPGVVLGPHDPYWGEGPILVENILRGRSGLAIAGQVPYVDVRDIATLHSAVMEPGKGPRRYMLSGHGLPFADTVALLGDLTGRKLSAKILPAGLVSLFVNGMDAMQGFVPFRLPISKEGFDLVRRNNSFDDSAAESELGIVKTGLEKTLTDMVRWMHSTGRISDQDAGKLASEQPV